MGSLSNNNREGRREIQKNSPNLTGRIVAIKFKTAQIQVLSDVFAALSCRTGVNFFAFFKRGEASSKRAWAWSATVEGIRVSRSRPASCSPEKRAKIAPVLQATVIVLVTPGEKKRGPGNKNKNLTCDQALFFFRGTGYRESQRTWKGGKEDAVLFSSPPKQTRKEHLTVGYQKPKKATKYK